MAVINIAEFIEKLNNGEIDLDTWEAIVNVNSLTVATRLNGNVNTWFGLQAALSAATGLVYTSKPAMDAAPGTKVGQAARVTEGPNAGLYLWSGSAWVKTIDPLEAPQDAAKYGIIPDRVFSPANPLTVSGYTRTTVNGKMRFTPITSSGTLGYADVILSGSAKFDPRGKVLRYRIQTVSGSANRAYIASARGDVNPSSNVYGSGLVADDESSAKTYEIDLSKRGDGSDWQPGELIDRILVPLMTPSLNNAVFDMDWLVWGDHGSAVVFDTDVKKLNEEIVDVNEKADLANTAAGTADAKAVAAQATADSAQTAAAQAATDAATADSKAVSAQQSAVAAQSTADNAVTAASTADGKAVAAQSTADTAVTAASEADSKAAGAQATADQAVTSVLNEAIYGITPNRRFSVANPLTPYGYTRANVGGEMVFTPITGSSDPGYAAVELSGSAKFDPRGKVLRYRLRVVSGSVNRLYLASVRGDINTTSNVYGFGLVASDEAGGRTYEVDLSKRADGSDWEDGELVDRILIPFTTPSLNDAVFGIEWLVWGNKTTSNVFNTDTKKNADAIGLLGSDVATIDATVSGLDSRIVNQGKRFPLKEMTRNGVISPENPLWSDVFLDMTVQGGDDTKLYRLEYLNNGNSLSAITDGVVLAQYDKANYATQPDSGAGRVRLQNYPDPSPTIDRTIGVQTIIIRTIVNPDIVFSITLDASKLPEFGTAMRSITQTQEGPFSWVIDPSRYFFKEAAPAPLPTGNLAVSVTSTKDVFAAYASSSDCYEWGIGPNGANSLPNIKRTRRAAGTNLQAATWVDLWSSVTDWIGPTLIQDTRFPSRAGLFFSGGNHLVDDKQTAQNLIHDIQIDGKPASTYTGSARQIDIFVVNKLMAANTVSESSITDETDRFVALQKTWYRITEDGSVFVRNRLQAMPGRTLTALREYGPQTTNAGFDESIMFAGGAAGARETYALNLNSGAASSYPDANAFILRSSANGQLSSWFDRQFGSDKREVDPTLPLMFIGDVNKTYHRALQSETGVTLNPGEFYEWQACYQMTSQRSADGVIDSTIALNEGSQSVFNDASFI